MQTIDGPPGPGGAPGPTTDAGAAPQVALRLVTTYDDVTRRFDIGLRGSEGVVVEGGAATPFRTEQVWPVVRDLLPPLEHLRADPPTARRTGPGARPGPGLAEDARAMVLLATVVGAGGGPSPEETEAVAVRTWLATDDELWSVTSRPDGSGDVREVPAGSVAEMLVWDVTGAMETLVRRIEAAS